ncbi:MAG TPA: chorismate-binding protein, partial [Euzebya sp.]|nr:chorismate-binding protein [Euzebya sp.]
MSGPDHAGGYRPGLADYIALAADHVLVPVVREVLADVSTPVSVYGRLRGPGSFLLESVEHGERWGRYSFIGLNPLITLRAAAGQVHLTGPVADTVGRAAATGDPLLTAQALIGWLTAPDLSDLPPLFAGLVGYLGWDVVRFIERLPVATCDDLGLDDARLALHGQVVAFDHLRQRLVVVTNTLPGSDPEGAYRAAVAASEALVASLAEPVAAPVIPPPAPTRVTDADANMTPQAYMASVEAAQAHIRAGDAFQVVPSQRFALDTTVDPLAVHRVLRVINPSPYMYLFDYGDLQVVGSSPEALVTVRDRTAQIWPIAGSQPRGVTQAEDAALETALLADDKERAEPVMLVDLARNDLGRIAEIGSVVV